MPLFLRRFRSILYIGVLLTLISTPAAALNKFGFYASAAGDVPKLKAGLETGIYFYGLGLLYNYYESVDYIPNSKPFEFDGSVYVYSVKGTRDIFAARIDFFHLSDGSLNDQNLSSFYVGYGRNEISGKMTVKQVRSENGSLVIRSADVRSKFILHSYMAGIFVTNISRFAVDLRLRYDTASIPIINEVNNEERDGKSLDYADFFPELLIGWAF